ncbi:GNAT family N-acetyltransferase [candidate division KSB1 bacterium]|nr:GNAT family N-acetyltransferase [candidate division KSB1 bacterium]
MLKGKLVALHAVEKEDLKQLRDWRNNSDFRKHFREYCELNMLQQEIWFEEKVVQDPSTLMFSIRRIEDNELLGCCGFVYINWVHRHADLSLYIGWEDAYIDDEGYAEESCKLLLDYGFKELCLNKVCTEIYEFDEKKKVLYEKYGFQQDGLLRQHYWYNGKWWDSRILSLICSYWIH